jgi:hypothetical protein
MKKIIIIAFCLAGNLLSAQDISYSSPGKNIYKELTNPAKTSAEEWSKISTDINVSFASDNARYPKERVPAVSSKEWTIKAWRGEKVHTQILVWTKKKISGLSLKTGDLSDEKGHLIKAENIKAAFVRYVMTDEFGEGCDERSPEKYDSSLVEDPIDITDQLPLLPGQPLRLPRLPAALSTALPAGAGLAGGRVGAAAGA